MIMTPDFKQIAHETVLGERYEARQGRAGEKLITMQGAPESSGCVCKFPKREGREHLQEARAVMMAAAPELYEALVRVRETGVFFGAIASDMIDEALKKARGEA